MAKGLSRGATGIENELVRCKINIARHNGILEVPAFGPRFPCFLSKFQESENNFHQQS
jgi:hypothetical protein